MQDVRCTKCNKLLGKLTAPYEVRCPRCKEMNGHFEYLTADGTRVLLPYNQRISELQKG